ncbi:MAG: response regulator transcription factor [Clostridium sp.]|jgi:DNA-binding response OmpR family regulator|uniref:response regulator transcription factor n=1 Tax=Clostridium sp. TaxID=1506 RepID=UPI0025C2D88E|nr:response regulator transcription factor [Clostridium sp.]MCH3965168.1 response regulator transcription factor [Clostridium sp.]MCI1714389.1 response regulator transcription factor [Clostridium sp.]MCI1798651.1 response regulator transcription factor [Clostridium sp.]MCI1812618.1 response regulator transcription factor [Clostridium sp.]MCI1869460.1 response regulator transcription factor [Clostridium sp.]
MRGKLLIVEDEESIAAIVKEHLEMEGYEVFWSSTGLEGLEDFKKQKFDLVMLDLMLPEMDGFSLCRNIRWISNVPIVIISAKQADLDKVKGLKLGADDYITKPFSLVEISARVEAHLRRYMRDENLKQNDDIISVKPDLNIFLNEKKVVRGSNEIQLTVKEFQLLLLMAQNPNKVFSKKEIYENVWNNVDIDGNNTVTVHVKALREKLHDGVKNPVFIQTVWGIGYKFLGEKK